MNEPNKPGLHTGGWFQLQTDEQLQRHINGGGPGNTFYEGAMREMARREAVRGSAQQMRWIKLTFWTALLIGLGSIVATVLTAG